MGTARFQPQGERARNCHSRAMTFLQVVATGGGFPITTTTRIWRVVVTSVPEKFAVKFMANGPNLYAEPVAWVLVRLFREGKEIIYPWMPVLQEEVWVVQPISPGLSGGAGARLELEPGVQANLTREIN